MVRCLPRPVAPRATPHLTQVGRAQEAAPRAAALPDPTAGSLVARHAHALVHGDMPVEVESQTLGSKNQFWY
jgi:hypothetical protein